MTIQDAPGFPGVKCRQRACLVIIRANTAYDAQIELRHHLAADHRLAARVAENRAARRIATVSARIRSRHALADAITEITGIDVDADQINDITRALRRRGIVFATVDN